MNNQIKCDGNSFPELSKCGDCALFENEDINGEAWCEFHQKLVRCDSKACKDEIGKGGGK